MLRNTSIIGIMGAYKYHPKPQGEHMFCKIGL